MTKRNDASLLCKMSDFGNAAACPGRLFEDDKCSLLLPWLVGSSYIRQLQEWGRGMKGGPHPQQYVSHGDDPADKSLQGSQDRPGMEY